MKRIINPLLILLLLLPWARVKRANGDSWKQFDKGAAFPSFKYPKELEITPDSGKGEFNKWTYKLTTPDANFLVIVNGFYYIPLRELKKGETSFEYLWRHLKRKYGKFITYHEKTEQTIIIVSIKNGVKTLQKIYLPTQDSSAAKSLIIRYPYSKCSIYDRWLLEIEKSWKTE